MPITFGDSGGSVGTGLAGVGRGLSPFVPGEAVGGFGTYDTSPVGGLNEQGLTPYQVASGIQDSEKLSPSTEYDQLLMEIVRNQFMAGVVPDNPDAWGFLGADMETFNKYSWPEEPTSGKKKTFGGTFEPPEGAILDPNEEWYILPASAAPGGDWYQKHITDSYLAPSQFGGELSVDYKAPADYGNDEIKASWEYAGGGIVEDPFAQEGPPQQGEELTPEKQQLLQAAIMALDPNSQLDEADREAILIEFENVFGPGSVEELKEVIAEQASGSGQVGGSGDGMSDSIPAVVDGEQPAALSSGEFVVPADAVSGVGNGSSEAGAQQLQGMVDRIRQARTGQPQQPPVVDPRGLVAG